MFCKCDVLNKSFIKNIKDYEKQSGDKVVVIVDSCGYTEDIQKYKREYFKKGEVEGIPFYLLDSQDIVNPIKVYNDLRTIFGDKYFLDMAYIGHIDSCFNKYKDIFSMLDIKELPFEINEHALFDMDDSDDFSDIYHDYDINEHLETFRNKNNINKTYRDLWAISPYPVIFNATDIIVIQDDNYVLITRKDTNETAIVGGFLEHDLTIRKNAAKELSEELIMRRNGEIVTMDESSLTFCGVFEEPNRSRKGRIITNVFMVMVDTDIEFEAADDAIDVVKIKMSDINNHFLYEDHRLILNSCSRLIGVL